MLFVCVLGLQQGLVGLGVQGLGNGDVWAVSFRLLGALFAG